MRLLPCVILGLAFLCPVTTTAAEVSLFDGTGFTGWEGSIGTIWRVEDGVIVAGRPDVKQEKNDFLCTTQEYEDFDLQVSYNNNRNNGGIQFRSRRKPNSHEVIGYQADFFKGGDGCLFDESRRRRMLAKPAPEVVARLGLGTWNHYRIRAEGPRIQLWVNGVQTVDYVEEDPSIPRRGVIALQLHQNATQIRYRDLRIIPLAPSSVP